MLPTLVSCITQYHQDTHDSVAAVYRSVHASAAKCNGGHAPLLIPQYTRHYLSQCCDSKSLSSLLLKEMNVQYVNHANPIMEHMLRHLCDRNQAPCARRCWFPYLPHVMSNDSLLELELAVVVLNCRNPARVTSQA